jgi:DNA-binding CsgD family transcriptional regulator
MLCWVGARAELWAPFEAAVGRLQPSVPDLLELCARSFGDPVRAAAPALDRLATVVGELGDETDPVQITRWAVPRRAGIAVTFAHHLRALVALGREDYEEAYHQAYAISPAGVLAPYTPHALWVLLDLVEAAVRTGRQAEASAHVAAMRDADLAAISPRLALLSAGSAAIAASDVEAPGLFEQALAVPGAERWPFDLARLRLAYGGLLRRTGTTPLARTQLGLALDTFQQLGARPWAARAMNELRAMGRHSTRARAMTPESITPQELEIAMMAASGLTNKQIGERLYLSPRTIGAHLYQVFPKLGVTSRAALRDALATPRGNEGSPSAADS